MDFNKLKVQDLKKELKVRGLSTNGNKNELVERLQASLNDTTGSADPVDDLDEDLLNDDDDEHIIDETESVLNDLDSPVETPVQTTVTKPVLKRKLIDPPDVTVVASKKIVLNRTPSVDTSVEEKNGTTTSEKEQIVIESESLGDKKIVKLSELSAKERLEMRAKKFNVALTGDVKKEARAERFGISKGATTTITTTGSNSIKSSAPTATADVLKQRAERFGVKVSTQLTKLENEERLKKRQERFGTATTVTAASNGNDEKAQQRLQRFKVK